MAKTDAIILAMPAAFFKEYTMERFLKDVEGMNTIDGYVWYMVRKNLPKIITKYCYWIIDGKIRYRMEISHFEVGHDYAFTRKNGGTRHFICANCIVLQGPVIEAPYEIPMRGFQGFRYTELIF
jgi:hypothetical protein